MLRTDSPPGHIGRGNEETCGLNLVERARGPRAAPVLRSLGQDTPDSHARINPVSDNDPNSKYLSS